VVANETVWGQPAVAEDRVKGQAYQEKSAEAGGSKMGRGGVSLKKATLQTRRRYSPVAR
jgi:hypothetical protein